MVKKEKNYPIYKDKHFTPICKGQPFKGNTINIIQKNDIKDKKHAELQIINTYYSGCVRQRYVNKDNKTYTIYHTFPQHTKWYNKKMTEINDSLHLVVPNSNIVIDCHEYGMTLKNEVEHEGMYFEGNIDNISRLKELSKLMKEFRKILKVNSKDDILSTVKGSKEVIGDDGNAYDAAHINFSKFFKLKGNK